MIVALGNTTSFAWLHPWQAEQKLQQQSANALSTQSCTSIYIYELSYWRMSHLSASLTSIVQDDSGSHKSNGPCMISYRHHR